MSTVLVERRRTTGDIVLGALVALAGVFILGDALFASTIVVTVIGVATLAAGVVLLVGGIVRAKEPWGWAPMAGGALLAVLGLFMLVNTGVALITFALISGVLFLVGGVVRLGASVHAPKGRLVLIVSGVVSIGLGLYLLFGSAELQEKFLGIVIGVQVVIEGITLIALGRYRVTATA